MTPDQHKAYSHKHGERDGLIHVPNSESDGDHPVNVEHYGPDGRQLLIAALCTALVVVMLFAVALIADHWR